MAYNKKTWQDRISEHPWRRRLLDVESGETHTVELERDEGAVHTEGDTLNAAALNGLEDRISTGFAEVDKSIEQQDSTLGALRNYTDEIAGSLGKHTSNLGNPHRISPGQIGAATQAELSAHTKATTNPHAVTAEQLGAVTPAQLEEHTTDLSNPHGVTLEMLGGASNAELAMHTANTANPHAVTAAQAGAYSTQQADAKFLHNSGTTAAPVLKGSVQGNADTAARLQTARSLRTNLASTATASFDGSANASPGVTGTLPVANGGTGNTTGLAASATKLATARNLSITGGATAAAKAFNGEANVALEVTALDVSKATAGTLPIARGGTGNTTGTAANSTQLNGQAASYYATAASVTSLTGTVNNKANTADVLTKANTTAYTPTASYHPATKAYVDANTGGNAPSADTATKLQTARTIQTNLASKTGASFDGTANITPGVTGTLPIANGGTGNTTGLAASATKLATARNLSITGGATAAAKAFNGEANVALEVTALDVSKATAGTLPVARGGTGNTTGTTNTAGSTTITQGGVTKGTVANNAGTNRTIALNNGDMLASVYDTNRDGVVDNAEQAKRLGVVFVGAGQELETNRWYLAAEINYQSIASGQNNRGFNYLFQIIPTYSTSNYGAGILSFRIYTDGNANISQSVSKAKWIVEPNAPSFSYKLVSANNVARLYIKIDEGWVNAAISLLSAFGRTESQTSTAIKAIKYGEASNVPLAEPSGYDFEIPIQPSSYISQSAADTRYAMLTGTQTIAGSKTFSSPVLVATPTANTHAATKKYVDDKVNGNAGSATKLQTARTVLTNLASTSSASFDGTANITPGVTGTLPVARGGTGNTTGLAASATKLATARNLSITGGATAAAKAFNGEANVALEVTALDVSKATAGTLPVARGGTGNTTGLAASATKLATARSLSITGGATAAAKSFNGEANVALEVTALDVSKATAGTLPVTRGGTGNTTGKAADSAKLNGQAASYYATASSLTSLTSTVNSKANTADVLTKTNTTTYTPTASYHPATKAYVDGKSVDNANTATKLQTARTVQTNLGSTTAVSFDGSANITPGVTGTLPVANGGTGNTTGKAADSAKLNGQAASYYATAAAASAAQTTANAALPKTGGTVSGNVTVGKLSFKGATGHNDSYLFQGSDSNAWIDLRCAGTGMLVRSHNGSAFRKVNASNTEHASSRRYKEDITPLADDAVAELLELPLYTFRYRPDCTYADGGILHQGFIAEEVFEQLGEAFIFRDEEGKVDGIKHHTMVAPLIALVRTLYKRVEEVQVHDLRKQVEEMQARINRLEETNK